MATSGLFLRYASPNELRTISREDLGFYNAVIIGAVYHVAAPFNVTEAQSYFAPLKQCIEEHPFLSALVADAHTDKAYYKRASSIALENHITVLPTAPKDQDAASAISLAIEQDVDRSFPSDIPRWRIVVLPLGPSEVCVLFSLSHTIGDGPTCLSFHRSFLKALRDLPEGGISDSSSPTAGTITTPNAPLGLPFDTRERLPISWGFLLKPALGDFLPKFMANFLGFKASASSTDEGTWLGTPQTFFDPETRHTKVLLREIEGPVLAGVLRAARAHDAKLTGVIMQLLSRALSTALPDPDAVTNFVCQTAVNMRKTAGTPAHEMGEFVSGAYVRIPRVPDPGPHLSDAEWASARDATRQLAETAGTLQDQPIGLLRYVSSVRGWMAAKLGQNRDSSIEISNVGAVADEGGDAEREKARIVKMVFAQPGDVNGPPFAINLVSVKGGSLVYTLTWQVGALGIPEQDEDGFMAKISQALDDGFKALSA